MCPRVLFTIHDRAWLDPEILAALERRYHVEVMETALPSPRRWSGRLMSKPEMLLGEFVTFLRLLVRPSHLRGQWRLVCAGGHFGALLHLRLLRALGRRRPAYLLNFYLHALGEHPVVRRVLGALLTDDVHVIAQTRGDAEYFRQFLPGENVKLVPYCQGPSAFVPFRAAEDGDYVFSGGWTNRDYDALFRCAARLPDIPFVVVASEHSPISTPVPANVTLHRDIEMAEFDRLLSGAGMATIPLTHDVGSSGQMVLLMAMQFAKPVVLPRLGAIADYVDDGDTAVLYAHGSDDALCRAIADLHGDAERRARIGAAARDAYLTQFTPEHYTDPVAAYLVA